MLVGGFPLYLYSMAKVLALDVGGKRTGVAITDELQIIAAGLTTVATENLFSYLTQLLQAEEIEALVVGKPSNLDGSPTDANSIVNQVSKKLAEKFPTLSLVFIDERFTSKLAKQSILDSGANKKTRRDKALVDKVSATIILQTYLEMYKR